MQAVILAGGLGTRLGEETSVRPKPMVEIGGMPILWHIMKIYSAADVNDFIVCLGYKGYMIKEYFANYFLHTADVTIDLKNNSFEVHQNWSEPWRITLVDTGPDTQTGGRLKAVESGTSPLADRHCRASSAQLGRVAKDGKTFGEEQQARSAPGSLPAACRI